MTAPAPTWLLVAAAQAVNAALCLWGALLLCSLAVWLWPSPRARKYLWCVPPTKVLLGLGLGVPLGSYVLSPFAGTRWELGRFMFGAGLHPQWHWPRLGLQLWAERQQQWYGLSGGDLIAHAAFYRGYGPWLVAALALIAGVSLLRVVRRVWAARAFARVLPRSTRTGRRLQVRRDGPAAAGAFTIGLWRPRIFLPGRSAGLSHGELRAILRHEAAHARAGDVALLLALGLFSDLCWFIPGVGLLERRARAAIERAADAWAVDHGADPRALAQAMLRVAEWQRAHAPESFAAGFYRGRSRGGEVLARVHALLEPSAQRGRAHRWSLAAFSGALALAALASTFFGYR